MQTKTTLVFDWTNCRFSRPVSGVSSCLLRRAAPIRPWCGLRYPTAVPRCLFSLSCPMPAVVPRQREETASHQAARKDRGGRGGRWEGSTGNEKQQQSPPRSSSSSEDSLEVWYATDIYIHIRRFGAVVFCECRSLSF